MGVTRIEVAVVGAGITGLVAATELRDRGADVLLLEAAPRAGGKVQTEPLAGVPIECGPDAFLTRSGDLEETCRRLGLAGSLVTPASGRAAIWTRGRARPIPEGLSFGVPSRPLALAASGILSPAGALRAGLDLVLPRTGVDEGTTVARLVERRFGREARERLVDPLLGGVYAGDTRRLGAQEVLPELYEAARKHRSLLLSLRGRPRPVGSPFRSLRGGLEELTDALAHGLGDRLRLSTPVAAITPANGGYSLSTPAGDVEARAVVLAAPAFVASPLVRAVDAEAAELLAGIRHAGVATIAFAYPARDLPATGTNGFLVAPREGRLLTAVTWVSEKWPHLSTPELRFLRCSTGRDGDERWRELDDGALVGRIRADLEELGVVRGEPVAVRVSRWEAALPQYEAGHGARLRALEERLAAHPGLVLAGAAFRGIGLAACAAQAKQAAAAVVDGVATPR